MKYDIVIIGAGVTGSSIARELSKYKLKICVIEAHSDVCEGTSKANSGIVHAGFDAKPGSLKAKLNVLGSKMMEPLSKELDFHYRRNGAMVVAFNQGQISKLTELAEQSIENGAGELEIINGDQARVIEPSLSREIVAALLVKTSGIVCPFNMTIAFAENAAVNGVEFRFNSKVIEIEKSKADFLLQIDNYNHLKDETTKQFISTKMIINAAGVYGAEIHNMAVENSLDETLDVERIIPRRGEYCLYDYTEGLLVNHTIFQVPTELGKGVLVTPTVHWNLMIGPNAQDLEDKENNITTENGLEEILRKGSRSLNKLPDSKKIITSFAGLRAHRPEDDFRIEEVESLPGFIDVIGIESPGLSCAPAIGPYVAKIVKISAKKSNLFELTRKESWKGTRKSYRVLWDKTPEERDKLIKENPAYGEIICRCEKVSRGEIEDAIRRPLGATTLDGLKRRVRPGSGRCQGGFCTPKLLEILAKNQGCTIEEITKSGGKSKIVLGAGSAE